MAGGKKLIAVFEDNPVDRFLYQRNLALVHDKIDYLIFDTPEKGFQMAQEISFDIVVINLHFWGTNFGFAILKKLQSISSSPLTAIAVTPFLQKGDLEKILSSGFTLCIEKPMVFKEINALI